MPARRSVMRATAIDINWHSDLPIFAYEPFLKAVGDEYGWLGGTDESGKLRCILPYTIIRKAMFRMVRFRIETILLDGELEVEEERAFLNSAIEYFRNTKADTVIPAATTTIFRTYPDGADVAPYGTYVIDLHEPEDALWRNVRKIYRQNILRAERDGVSIRSGVENFDVAYALVRDTFRRSKLPFMSYDSFKRYVLGLGEYCKIIVAYYKEIPQGCTVYAFSNYCAYAVYGGSIDEVHQGAIKLVDWEAIRTFKGLGVQRFDFVGARIDPTEGSKQDTINSYKRRLGGKLKVGYIWKYPLRPMKSIPYSVAVRLFRGGDIVDAERHKMRALNTSELEGTSRNED
jgi:hypothetical protein